MRIVMVTDQGVDEMIGSAIQGPPPTGMQPGCSTSITTKLAVWSAAMFLSPKAPVFSFQLSSRDEGISGPGPVNPIEQRHDKKDGDKSHRGGREATGGDAGGPETADSPEDRHAEDAEEEDHRVEVEDRHGDAMIGGR